MVLIRWGRGLRLRFWKKGRLPRALDGTYLPRAPTLAAPLPSVSCSTRLSHGNPHPARLRLSVHSIPDESQKKAFQNKIRGAACVSRCQAGHGALIPPHKCGSDTAAQNQPRPKVARDPSSNGGHEERKPLPRLESKHLRLFFGSRDDSHRIVLSG